MYSLFHEQTAFLKEQVAADNYVLGWITDQDTTSFTAAFQEGPI